VSETLDNALKRMVRTLLAFAHDVSTIRHTRPRGL